LHTLLTKRSIFAKELSCMKKDQIVIYQTEDGQTQIDIRLENETVWLTQAQMAELFETDRTSIVRHINNIYKADELEREATCAKIAQVQKHLNTSLFCAESLCGKGFQGSEVFAKHLTLLLTLDLT